MSMPFDELSWQRVAQVRHHEATRVPLAPRARADRHAAVTLADATTGDLRLLHDLALALEADQQQAALLAVAAPGQHRAADEDAPGTPHEDTVAQRAARRARELEEAHGANLRQCFAGYEGEHDFPGWRCIPWKTRGGYGNQAHGRGRENSERERLWLSPNCLSKPQPLQGSLL